ncbi:MAG: L-threonylcarbamoyladenylate synthase [Hyphomicrobiaceae bacterium]
MTQPRTTNASSTEIDRAAAIIRAGGLVAFPTETVFGLGADATNPAAVAKIYATKQRPEFNPLIIHTPDVDSAAQLGRLSKPALRLAEVFWPGPLTLVVTKRPDAGIAEIAVAGLPTVALRIPDHAIAQALLRAADRPIAAPSANRSGRVSATRASHVADDFGSNVDLILNDPETPRGLESTIVDVTGNEPAILRVGAITQESIARLFDGNIEIGPTPALPSAPGQLSSHYAPSCPVRMNVTQVREGEVLLAFGTDVPAHSCPAINLSPTGDLVEAASRLFAALRELDQPGARAIAIMPIPNDGLGAAINDRLRRAAAPRPVVD